MNNQILITIPLQEFEQLQKDWIRDVLKENEPIPPPTEEKYLTRQQTAQILQISLPTLHEWTKKGIIKGFRINSRVRFKKSEIENAFKEIDNYKYQRRRAM